MTAFKELALGWSAAVVALSAGAAPVLRNPQPVPIPLASVGELLTGDFNGDGHPDLLIMDPGQNLAVLLDNGVGPFAEPVVSPLPYATGRPALADLNRDGKLDIVVSDALTSTFAVMFGNGDGTFTPGASVVTPGSPGPIAVGDFNGDGFLDVAVALSDTHSGSNSVAFYFGDGTGHFSGATTASIFEAPDSLIAADVNRDGRQDLIASGYWGVRVLVGDGAGGLTPAWWNGDGKTVAAGDFNHDGKLDLAIGGPGFVEVFLGNGDATFTRSAVFAVDYVTDTIVATDIDGDGNLDLLATGWAGSDIAFLRGRGDGTFDPPEFFLSGPGTWKLVTGDFDRDGKIDFVTLDYNAQAVWAMSFVRGNGDGSFRSYRAFHTTDPGATQWDTPVTGGVVADMNNDGKPDVVVIQKHPGVYSCDLGVMLNDGAGTLGTAIVTDTGMDVWVGNPAFALGDVNGDGKLDAVVLADLAYTPTAETLLGDGAGGFGAPIPFPVTTWGQPILGHFGAGPNLDLLVLSDSRATVYPGNGDGTFGSGIISNVVESGDVLVGDLNGDGKLDYVALFAGFVNTCFNDGTGRFSCTSLTSEGGNSGAVADFNGDGKLDLLLTTPGGTQIRFGNGDGTFGVPVDFTLTPGPSYPQPDPVSVADFDGDGLLDVALGTAIYLSNGDGTFRSRVRFRTIGATSTAPADMDDSGSPDLVVTKKDAGDVDVLLTRTTGDPIVSPSITVEADLQTTAYGQSVTFTATVTGGATALSGAVLFTIDGRSSALIDVDGAGKAKFTTGFGVGTHSIGGTYTGDEYYRTSTVSTDLVVSRATPTVSVAGYPNPQALDGIVTIAVGVGAYVGYGIAQPTGTLTLREGNTPLGVQVKDGRAFISTLSLGSHVISADYSGDQNFAPRSGSYTQVIVGTPTLSSIDPAFGSTRGEQTVTIAGTNLGATTAVMFGEVPAPSFTVLGDMSIVAKTPPRGTRGPVDVMVVTAGGTARLPGGYLYISTARRHLKLSP